MAALFCFADVGYVAIISGFGLMVVLPVQPPKNACLRVDGQQEIDCTWALELTQQEPT